MFRGPANRIRRTHAAGKKLVGNVLDFAARPRRHGDHTAQADVGIFTAAGRSAIQESFHEVASLGIEKRRHMKGSAAGYQLPLLSYKGIAHIDDVTAGQIGDRRLFSCSLSYRCFALMRSFRSR